MRDDGGAAEAFGADVTDGSGRSASWPPPWPAGLARSMRRCVKATGPSQPEAPVADVAWGKTMPPQLDLFVKSPALLGRAVLARHAGP